MPLLQVRDCPEDIYAQISQRANAERRTIAQQTLVLLEKGLEKAESDIERRRRVIREIEAQDIPEEVRAIDPVKLIREDHNR
jgi:Fe-S cluster biosynthesis and repair protein YggX